MKHFHKYLKGFLIFVFVGFIAIITHGQDSTKARIETVKTIHLNPLILTASKYCRLNAGITYETPIYRTLGLHTYTRFTSNIFGNEKGRPIFSTYMLDISPRWYFNYGKRSRNGRNTINNASDFVQWNNGFYMDPFKYGDYRVYPYNLTTAFMVGTRRNLFKSKSFFGEVAIGYGRGFNRKATGLYENRVPDYGWKSYNAVFWRIGLFYSF